MKASIMFGLLLFLVSIEAIFDRDLKSSSRDWMERRQIQKWSIDPSVKYMYENLADYFGWMEQPATPPFSCEVCEFMIGEFQRVLQENGTEDDAGLIFTDICVLLEIEIYSVCQGLASEFAPEVFEILTTEYLTPSQVCTYFLICPKSESKSSLTISPPSSSVYSIEPKLPKSHRSGPPHYFLHLTDIHHDALYQPNTKVNCDTPLCCRTVYGAGNASIWGEYKCDSNKVLLQSLFSHVSSSFDFDFIIWTGDNPPHDIWEESKTTQLDASLTVVNYLLKYFPTTEVFPAIGNHESFPVDQFPGPPKNNWLMSATSRYWSQWLTDEGKKTVGIGGYYSKMFGKLKVISLNTQYCDINNFWMVLNDTDPAGQLQWLNNELYMSEQNNETVYIIGHIPFDDSTCLYDYSSKVEQIVKRYYSIIESQFYGHTHLDDFFLYHADKFNNSQPINVAFIAPSVTPYTYINPSFRVFEYDPDTFEIIDYHQYHLNLAETIQTNQSNWVKYYSAKEYYGLNSMQPSEWESLVERFQQNDTLFQGFVEHFYTGYPVSKCVGQCKIDFVCGVRTSTFKEQFTCSGDEYNLSNLWPWIMNHLA